MHPRRLPMGWAGISILAALFCSTAVGSGAAGPDPVHWVATWSTAHQMPRNVGRGGRAGIGNAPAATPPGRGPAVPPVPAAAGRNPGGPPVADDFNNQTVRMIVRTSLGGRRIRLQFSNVFGSAALELGAAHVAMRAQESGIVQATDRALTFNGAPSTTIPVGAIVVSDPVDLVVAPLSELAVSVFVPQEVTMPSWHLLSLQPTYVSAGGDFTGAATLPESRVRRGWYWLSEIDVVAPERAATVVALGDSITDGDNSTSGANRSWPSLLAERMIANRSTAGVAVVNMGIAGNRVLNDAAGVNVLARFDRDVISVAGARWVVITEGINDIGGIARGTPVTADALIGALKQMIERAHTHDIKVIGGTLTPFEGSGVYTENGEAIRVSLNSFIRTSRDLDGVADFDAATRDTANARQIRLGFNNGDHLHPNDAGYRAMADAVTLTLFKN